MTAETLLIEIGTEELPPIHLNKLSSAFAEKITQAFAHLGISYGKVEDFVTPRRIATQIFAVPDHQPARVIQKRGPTLASAYDAKGNPSQAAIGFARSCKVEVTDLKVLETPQGSWLMFEQAESGKALAELLPDIIEGALHTLPTTKKMRWGASSVEFIRPIHWITVLHGSKTLPIKVFDLIAGNTTRGHRFYFPQPITLPHANDYVSTLRTVKVLANYHERQQIILDGISQQADKHQANAIIDEILLDQVTHLVEWPVALSANFNDAFLEVPQEALISSMQNHQKCFPIQNDAGKLLPTFIVISNIEETSSQKIIHGNERVMQARLADAKFFFDQDRKTPLSSRLEGLKNMIFQKKLGTLYDKSYRISKLAGLIAKQIGVAHNFSERAGKLCKADLLTEMVFEFPELQGIMGCYYAAHDGEPTEVTEAIRESYLPRFAKDLLPNSSAGICVALADRLDSLIGIFGICQMPTGDKDPFGLRRQALAILRILIEKALPLDLEALCKMARQGYGSLIDEEIIQQVLSFCHDRFKAWYHEQGLSLQTLESIMVNHQHQPFDCSQRALAVNHFQTLPEAQHLAAANKRVRNILQKNGIIYNIKHLPQVSTQLFKEPAEIALFAAIQDLKIRVEPMINQGHYQEALVTLAQLQKPVDTFFDEVMVMTDDEKLKQNRINLLTHLSAIFMQIADISKLAL